MTRTKVYAGKCRIMITSIVSPRKSSESPAHSAACSSQPEISFLDFCVSVGDALSDLRAEYLLERPICFYYYSLPPNFSKQLRSPGF